MLPPFMYEQAAKNYTLRNMIARTHRFHGYGSLNGVYRRGQTIREPNLSLKFLARRPGQASRVAVVVSKKVNKSAVVRNRIRRRIYEILRQQDAVSNLQADMVFTVFSDELAHQNQQKLQATIKSMIQKAVKNTGPNTGDQRPPHAIVNTEGKQ